MVFRNCIHARPRQTTAFIKITWKPATAALVGSQLSGHGGHDVIAAEVDSEVDDDVDLVDCVKEQQERVSWALKENS